MIAQPRRWTARFEMIAAPRHLAALGADRRQVLDRDSGELVERVTYLAFGATESDTRSPRWQNFREDYRFTGKEEDIEVGLTYFGGRYYSAPLGRWMSADPLAIHALGADLNPYAYVSGSPFAYTDPTGFGGNEPGPTPATPPPCSDCSQPGGGSSGGVTGPFIPHGHDRSGYDDKPGPPADVSNAAGPSAEPNTGAMNDVAWAINASLKNFLVSVPAGIQAFVESAPYTGNDELQESARQEAIESWRQYMEFYTPSTRAGRLAGDFSRRLFFFVPLIMGSPSGGLLAEARTLPAVIAEAADVEALALRMPSNVVNPWAGNVISTTAAENLVMYRVWGGGAGQVGSWLTPVAPVSAEAATASMALLPSNVALLVSKVVVPAGTRFQIGVAAPGFGQPGGAVQVQLLENIPVSSFDPGSAL